MKIHTGDNVIITTGKDRGKTGKVVRVLAQKNAVIVEGLNVMKKHVRPRGTGAKGGIVDKAMPINISNVSLLHPKTKKATRAGYAVSAGKKTRQTRGNGGVVTI